MQSVSAAFTAEERDSVRSIAHNLQVSWKKYNTLGNRTFTIGVSRIGGNDIIGINPGAIGSPGNYQYFDESQYVLGLAWERGLKIPTGGLAKAMAEATLDNTTGRFTPRYMGGNSELFTSSYKPRRPFIINAGFDFGGIDQVIPQFAGITTRPAEIDVRNKSLRLIGSDYVDFFENRYLDREVMFTGQRTDQVMSTLLSGTLGMTTGQYDLDYGINVIPFGLFEKGTRMSTIFDQLAAAEYGHFYQDESGIFKFENRQHWDASPYNAVQRIMLTGQVIDAVAPDEDHIVNVVEIRSDVKEKQPLQTIFSLPVLTTLLIPTNGSIEQFFEFQDPVLQLTNPTSGGANSFFVANSLEDESGTDLSSNITFQNLGTFAKAVKYRIKNTGQGAYITQLVLAGRTAKTTNQLYYRAQDDSSVTAYEERVLTIDNPYIQNEDWAASLSRLLLDDFSDLETLQKITIRAIPELQLGDLISWQGRLWRIYNIQTTLQPESGFVQELTMLQRTISTYFRIGISTIGGPDKIAP